MTEPDSSVSLPSDLTEDPPNNKYGSNDDQHYSRVSHSQDGRNTTRKQFSHQTNNTSVRDIQIDDKHQKSQRQVNVTDGFHSIPDSSAAFSDVGAESFNAFQYARGSNAPNSLTRTQSLDSDIPVTSPHESVEEYQRRSQDICSAYLMGQLSNVAKAAVWWSTFGVVAEALTKIALAVGTTRLVFNLALVLMSPLAGTVAENTNIQTLLNYTTWGRLFIWCCCIPASWFYFASYLGSFTSFYVCFLILMFLDGIQVSFANVVDIDCGGLDTLATQYKLSIGSYLRDRFNRIHQIVFDLSFILLTPPVAFLIWQIAFRFDHHNVSKKTLLSYVSGVSLPGVEFDTKLHYAASFLQQGDGPTTKPMETGEAVDTSENTDIAVLMIGICGVFGILSIYSLWSYWGHLSTKSQRQSLQYSNEQDIVTQSGRSEHTTIESSGSLSSWQMTWSRFHDVKDGFFDCFG